MPIVTTLATGEQISHVSRVDNAMMATMATETIKANNGASTATPSDVTQERFHVMVDNYAKKIAFATNNYAL